MTTIGAGFSIGGTNSYLTVVRLPRVARTWGAAFRRWFEQGLPAGPDPNLSDSLVEIGQDPGRVLIMAQAERIEAALSGAAEQAMALGIFGSPSVVVDGEIFWGDDRWEVGIAWAAP